jgi:hypothetical protein
MYTARPQSPNHETRVSGPCIGALVDESPQMAAEPTSATLSGCKVLGEIGRGGMARVLLAFDPRLGRKVAIKLLDDALRGDTQIRTRFMQEARAIARLNHPNIVQIFQLGAGGEPPHFVMEYVEGAPLAEAARPLALAQKIELMRKAVLAVDFLHQHSLLHRDLKPGNILVTPNLQPKLLDFGLARVLDDRGQRPSVSGEFLGTPQYFSPEQTRADTELDARSDVFSLGTILYELLTDSLPFRGETLGELAGNIRNSDPVLPRRVNSSIPGDLQKICLKALEKNPADRYSSARELADDLQRYLAGEPVLAAPTAYARLVGDKIERHLRELQAWQQDHIITQPEFDALRNRYERLFEREDAWIMEVRRLSLSQVTLYLGAWVMVVAAALIFLFPYQWFSGGRALFVVVAATIPTGWFGVHCWRRERIRIAVAYLLAFCLMLPVAWLVFFHQTHWFASLTRGREDLEFFFQFESFKHTTNAQMFWAIVFSMPAYLWLRRFTRSSVFSLIFAALAALLSWVVLLRMGLLEWLNNDPGLPYLRLIPFALLFFAAALLLERLRCGADSRYFYPIAVGFTFVALSGMAAQYKPYADWLARVLPRTRGELEYLFIINAGFYYVLQRISDRVNLPQMRSVAKTFRFVIPGHVMTSLLILGLHATQRWEGEMASATLRHEARFFEFLLPFVAALFVFGSIGKQMKNFLASGLVFLAIGLVRLEQNYFQHRAIWPLALLVLGLALMYLAVNYPALRVRFAARWQRTR